MLAKADHDDLGLGLVELIVGIFVSTIVLGGIAAVLVNSWMTQSDVLSTSEATSKGQLMSSSIEQAMRNALDFKTENSDSDLWVWTSFDTPTGTDSRTCQAFSLADNEARVISTPDNLDDAIGADSWGSWVDDAQQNWTVRVQPIASSPLFARNGRTLTYAFEIDTDSSPVLFQGSVSMRAPSTGATNPCW